MNYHPWMAVVGTLVVCAVLLIPLFLYLRGVARKSRELDRKALESEAWCRHHGIELGCHVYTYDANTDSFIRRRP